MKTPNSSDHEQNTEELFFSPECDEKNQLIDHERDQISLTDLEIQENDPFKRSVRLVVENLIQTVINWEAYNSMIEDDWQCETNHRNEINETEIVSSTELSAIRQLSPKSVDSIANLNDLTDISADSRQSTEEIEENNTHVETIIHEENSNFSKCDELEQVHTQRISNDYVSQHCGQNNNNLFAVDSNIKIENSVSSHTSTEKIQDTENLDKSVDETLSLKQQCANAGDVQQDSSPINKQISTLQSLCNAEDAKINLPRSQQVINQYASQNSFNTESPKTKDIKNEVSDANDLETSTVSETFHESMSYVQAESAEESALPGRRVLPKETEETLRDTVTKMIEQIAASKDNEHHSKCSPNTEPLLSSLNVYETQLSLGLFESAQEVLSEMTTLCSNRSPSPKNQKTSISQERKAAIPMFEICDDSEQLCNNHSELVLHNTESKFQNSQTQDWNAKNINTNRSQYASKAVEDIVFNWLDDANNENNLNHAEVCNDDDSRSAEDVAENMNFSRASQSTIFPCTGANVDVETSALTQLNTNNDGLKFNENKFKQPTDHSYTMNEWRVEDVEQAIDRLFPEIDEFIQSQAESRAPLEPFPYKQRKVAWQVVCASEGQSDSLKENFPPEECSKQEDEYSFHSDETWTSLSEDDDSSLNVEANSPREITLNETAVDIQESISDTTSNSVVPTENLKKLVEIYYSENDHQLQIVPVSGLQINANIKERKTLGDVTNAPCNATTSTENDANKTENDQPPIAKRQRLEGEHVVPNVCPEDVLADKKPQNTASSSTDADYNESSIYDNEMTPTKCAGPARIGLSRSRLLQQRHTPNNSAVKRKL